MAAGDPILNGSSMSWTPDGGAEVTIEPLTNFNYDDSPAKAIVTGAEASLALSQLGRSKESITIDFVGAVHCPTTPGEIGALEVTLNDGGDVDAEFAACRVTRVHCAGRIDQRIDGSFTVRPGYEAA
jgi:hypothetical protein